MCRQYLTVDSGVRSSSATSRVNRYSTLAALLMVAAAERNDAIRAAWRTGV